MNKIFDKNIFQLKDALTSNGYMDKMYEAVSREDVASAIRVALEIVQQTSIVPATELKCKSDEKAAHLSKILLTKGVRSLEPCNLVFSLALNKSQSMFEGHLLRMQLLAAVNAPIAALNDLETCLSMKPPEKIVSELLELKNELSDKLKFENFKNMALHTHFGQDYFTFNVKRNKDIPCVSADVAVVRENGRPKIVAAKNLEIGKLVAIERAFAIEQDEDNRFISCYHCLKFSFNLIPCDGCCYAMFCDESCKRSSMYGYHKIECPIMDYIYSVATTTRSRLAVKAAIKIKQSQSWDEVIAASRNLGADLPTSGSDGEIYNSQNVLSVLHFTRRKHFVHGKMFNQSLLYATIVDKLSLVPNFYPRDQERKLEAMCALGNIMVQLFIHFPHDIKIVNAAENYLTANVSSEPEPNFGWFSFASKLSHCCEPNLLTVGLNDKIALVVLKSINKGEELTICHMGHWYENIYEEGRSFKLFEITNLRCECRVCLNNWSPKTRIPANLDAEQRKCYRKYVATVTSLYPGKDKIDFRETCHAMKLLQHFPNTNEHYKLFQSFRNSFLAFQYSITENKVIMDNEHVMSFTYDYQISGL